MIEMELSRIVISETTDEQVIVLREVGGGRAFPIVIGIWEALSIDRGIKGRKTQGVIVFNTAEGERVVSVERVSEEGEANGGG